MSRMRSCDLVRVGMADGLRCRKCSRMVSLQAAALESPDVVCAVNWRALEAYWRNGGRSYTAYQVIAEWR